MINRSLAVERLERRYLLDAKLVVDISTLKGELFFEDELSPREIREVAPLQDSLLFYVHYDSLGTGECWQQTGRIWQTTGEQLLQPIDLGSINDHWPATAQLGVTVGDTHYFSIEDECSYTAELWSTRGSFGERMQNRRVHEWPLGDASDDSLPPENFTEFAGSLFVTVSQVVYGNELWKVRTRVQLVKDINPRSNELSGYSIGAFPEGFTAVNGMLFFTANDGVRGRELWVTDGTEANTRIVKDIVPSIAASGGYEELVSHGDALFLSVHDGEIGRELWRSDGTREGTIPVKDIYQGGASSNPEQLTSVGDLLFFVGEDGVHGRELWASDGSADGTRMVVDLRPGNDSSEVSELSGVGDTLYFVVRRQGTAASHEVDELWTSDGTEHGTQRLLAAEGGIDQLTSSDGKLFFVADSGFGPRLWQTEGSSDDTFMVNGLPASTSTIEKMVDVRGALYFTTDSSQKLWHVDANDRSRWGDVNQDGELNALDIDQVFEAIGRPAADSSLDIDLDGAVTENDSDVLIREILGTVPGDINLDGLVDDSDYALWAENRFRSNTTWQSGDLNGDRKTDSSDFNILTNHRPPMAAIVAAPSEVRAGDGPIEFQVRFGPRIDPASIDDQDLLAIRSTRLASMPLELVTIDKSDGQYTTATYRLTPFDGEWTWEDVTEDLEIVLRHGAVHSADQVGIPRTNLALLTIQPELELPNAMLFAGRAIVVGDEDATVAIKYADNTRINTDALDGQDIVLQNAMGEFETVFVESKLNSDGSVIATYQVADPVGLRLPGEYQVRVIAGQVVDSGGNAVPGSVLGSVLVEHDDVPATAFIDRSHPAHIADDWRSIVVVYQDNRGIDLDTIESSSLEVVRESNGEVLRARFLRSSVNDEGNHVEAHYFVESNNSQFSAPESVVVRADGVFDVGNNALVSKELGTIVLHPEVPSIDYLHEATGAKLGSRLAALVRFSFGGTHQVGWWPSDNEPDIVVRHQTTGQLLAVDGGYWSGDCDPNGCRSTTLYFLFPPSGKWTGRDQGTYHVRLIADQVRIDGEPLPESIIGTFTIGSVPQDADQPQELDQRNPNADSWASARRSFRTLIGRRSIG